MAGRLQMIQSILRFGGGKVKTAAELAARNATDVAGVLVGTQPGGAAQPVSDPVLAKLRGRVFTIAAFLTEVPGLPITATGGGGGGGGTLLASAYKTPRSQQAVAEAAKVEPGSKRQRR